MELSEGLMMARAMKRVREQLLITSMRYAVKHRRVKELPAEATEQDRMCFDWLKRDEAEFLKHFTRWETAERSRTKGKPRGRGFGSQPDPGADLARDLIGEFFEQLQKDGYQRVAQ